MHEIDKAAFGRFVCAERRRLGLTQKQLAERVMVSDKAVSKWETGVSLPDIQLLEPLAQALEVTTADLLACQRLETAAAGEAAPPVDALVYRALYYNTRHTGRPNAAQRRRWGGRYACAAAAAVLGTGWLLWAGRLGEVFWGSYFTMVLLGLVFGVYFCFFVPQRLPAYYDENAIDFFTDGPLRIHLTGVRLNNRNWPAIVRVCRVWALALTAGAPPLQFVCSLLPAAWGHWAALGLVLAVTLGGLFLPVYAAARRTNA